MNKLLEKLVFKKYIKKDEIINEESLSDITTNLQGAKENQVVFYKIGDGEKAILLFLERLANSSAGLVFVNKNVSKNYSKIPVVEVTEGCFQQAQEEVLDHFFGKVKPELKIFGVTGTNGKTTVAYLGMQIANFFLNKNALYIGTTGVYLNGRLIEEYSENTTPSNIFLRKILHQYPEIDLLLLEMSSHALEQNRLPTIKLDVGGFISFSQDHLDYHKTMDNYLQAKLKIFNISKSDIVVPPGQKFLSPRKKLQEAKLLSDYAFEKIPARFQISFNKANLEVSLSMINHLWKLPENINIDLLKLPRGRFDEMKYGERNIVVDYAHTPDALEKLLFETVKVFKNTPLWVVFGCGGDRDRTKRPLMGQVVEKYADQIVVTSDNPRSEDPSKIIEDIKSGIKIKKIHNIADRKEAIRYSLEHSENKSVIIVAGKGHEEYQEVCGIKRAFSDFDVVKNYFKGS